MKRTLRSNSIAEAMFFLFSVEVERVCERNGFEVLPAFYGENILEYRRKL